MSGPWGRAWAAAACGVVAVFLCLVGAEVVGGQADARAQLARRARALRRLDALQERCDLGEVPSQQELSSLSRLFDGARVTVTRRGRAVVLVFADPAGVGALAEAGGR